MIRVIVRVNITEVVTLLFLLRPN